VLLPQLRACRAEWLVILSDPECTYEERLISLPGCAVPIST